MTKEHFAKKKLPDSPGVYFFLGARKEILYIGKATSLRNRVKSYFTHDLREKRSDLIEKMVAEAKSLSWTKTDSVLEALLLEANLIRTHKPRFNTDQKDDKSFNHVVITKEEFPRVLVIRGKDLTEQFEEKDLLHIFGPYPSGMLFREAMKIIRRIFLFYDTKVPVTEIHTKLGRGVVDFNRQIGLYPNTKSKGEYLKNINHIVLFFEGKKKRLIAELEKEMMRAAKLELFEKAQSLKRKIFALTHINDVALLKRDVRVYHDDRRARIEAYDIAHLGGADMVGVMTVVVGGVPQPSEYRKFKIRSIDGSNDPAALKEVLERRLSHSEWQMPHMVVVDGSTAQKNAAEYVLKKNGVLIPVIAVVKDEHHKPKRILAPQKLLNEHEEGIILANAEAHRFAIAYHRQSRRTSLR